MFISAFEANCHHGALPIMTIFPRLCDLVVSDCQVGTVEVFIPNKRVSQGTAVFTIDL